MKVKKKSEVMEAKPEPEKTEGIPDTSERRSVRGHESETEKCERELKEGIWRQSVELKVRKSIRRGHSLHYGGDPKFATKPFPRPVKEVWILADKKKMTSKKLGDIKRNENCYKHAALKRQLLVDGKEKKAESKKTKMTVPFQPCNN
ncbi:hypothetical protein L596_006143 [Steinernema carpocapsae]|uniref:Uncharacterized protein n=1 Tax=Steinernema carpocapsae TaxID=34508 RepID=A0A4U8V1G3_STECR|nr:hypothetical protein L596_006143 [Steinernema carpocapsae]